MRWGCSFRSAPTLAPRGVEPRLLHAPGELRGGDDVRPRTGADADAAAQHSEGVRGFAIDGAIIVDPAERDPRTTLFGRLGLPVVTIERDSGRADERWYVATNADVNTRTMLDHLAQRGAEEDRAALAARRLGVGDRDQARHEAWTREHAARPIVVTVPLTPADEGAFAGASRLLRRRTPPDAIFIAAARFIRGTLRAAKELGRDIPGSLLLGAGVDSIHAREGDPPVTALDLHPELQAEAAVEMLLAPCRAPRGCPSLRRGDTSDPRIDRRLTDGA